jgi:hypothetical protein
MGHSDKPASEFSDHHDCRLGKWYYEGDGKECFSKLNGYRELELPHEKVHSSGIQAIESYRNGDMDAAISKLQKMESSSMEVIELLEKMAVDGEQSNKLMCTGDAV